MIRALLLLAVLAPTAAHAGNYGKFDVTASHVHVISLYLPAGWVTLETYDLVPTRGADTVIHLMDPRGVEVGWSDDYQGSTRSLIHYNVPSPAWYQLVVRSYSTGSGGTCSVAMNSTPLETNVPFGGAHVTTNTISTDIVQTALLNQGADDTVVYGLDSGGHLLASNDDSGVGYASKLGGAYAKVVVGTYGWTAGPTRVYVNDAASDSDGDGLGPQLESAICTCDYPNQMTCNGTRSCNQGYMVTAMDTDADGIRDDHEVFGLEKDFNDPYDFPQHLPKWGAKPDHKDIFLEMDWAYPGSPDNNYAVSPTVALTTVSAYVRAGTAGHLGNPDWVDGVAVHIDIGVLNDGNGGTSYGDWGGATGYQAGTVGCGCGSQTVTLQQFVKSRRNVFHYGLATPNTGVGGHQCCGWSFVAGHTDGLSMAHELGHNVGMDHGGTVAACIQNGKPNYKSIMNYAMSSYDKFSLGEFLSAPLNPMSLCETDGLKTTDQAPVLHLMQSPFNYTVSKVGQYWGVDWNRDGTISGCGSQVRAAPNYQKGWGAEPELGRYYMYRKDFTPAQPQFVNANADPWATPSLVHFAGNMNIAYRNTSGQIKLLYTSKADFSACPELYAGCASWTELTVNSGAADAGGPALGVHTYSGVEYLVVVWKQVGELKYSLYNTQYSQQLPYGSVPGSAGALYEPSLANYLGDLVLLYLKGQENQLGTPYANFMWSTGVSWSAAAVQKNMSDQPLQVYSVLAAASYPGLGGTGLRAVLSYYDPPPPVDNYYPKWFEYKSNNRWDEILNTIIGSNSMGSVPKRRAGLTYIKHPSSTGLPGGRWYYSFSYPAVFGSTCTSDSQCAAGFVCLNGTCIKSGGVFVNMTRGDGNNALLKWENLVQYDNTAYSALSGVSMFAWRPTATGEVAEPNVRWASVFFIDKAGMLDFRPFGDGIVSVSLQDSNDWQTMSHGICASLAGGAVPACP